MTLMDLLCISKGTQPVRNTASEISKVSLTTFRLPGNTRNSSGDEIANMNFLYDDIVHALENTKDTSINSPTDRFLQRRFTKFSEISQCNGTAITPFKVIQGKQFRYQSKAHK